MPKLVKSSHKGYCKQFYLKNYLLSVIVTNSFQELLDDSKATEVTGDIKYVHRFVDMPNEKATATINGSEAEVCAKNTGSEHANAKKLKSLST